MATTLNKVSGKTGQHSFSEAEATGYANYINNAFANDEDLKSMLPLNAKSLFDAVAEGYLLCKLINYAVPNTIAEKDIKLKPKNAFEVTQNHNACISAASKIGCSVVNIGAQDLASKLPHLVLGLTWQIVKRGLFSQVISHTDEYMKDIPPEQILLTWLNSHLQKAGSKRVVTNFHQDLQDGEVYAILLSQIASDKCVDGMSAESDATKRTELVVETAQKLGIPALLSSSEILQGNPRLNLAFVASLFNTNPKIASDVSSLKQNLEKTREQVTQLGSQLEEVSSQNESLSAQVSQLNELLENCKQTHEEEKKKHRESATALETSNQKLLESVTTLTDQNTTLTKRLSTITEEKKSIDEQLNMVTAQNRQLLETLTTINKQSQLLQNSLNTSIQQLKSALDRTTAEKEETTRELSKANTQIQSLTEQVQNLTTENEKSAATAKRVTAERDDIKTLLQIVTDSKDTYQRKFEETDAALTKQKQDSSSERQNLLNKIAELEYTIKTLEKTLEQQKVEIQQKDKELDSLATQKESEMLKLKSLLAESVKEGWLNKEGHGLTKEWKKRYFILSGNHLSWYDSPEEAQSKVDKPLGVIQVEDTRVYEVPEEKIKKKFVFEINTAKKKYLLSADNGADVKDWMKAITVAKSKKLRQTAVSTEEVPNPEVKPGQQAPQNKSNRGTVYHIVKPTKV